MLTSIKTKLFKTLDLNDKYALYLLGLIKYTYIIEIDDKISHITTINDVYYNILKIYFDRLSKLNVLKENCGIGKEIDMEFKDYVHSLLDEIGYIKFILSELDAYIYDKRMSIHLLDVIDQMERYFKKLVVIDILDNKNQIVFKNISNEMFRIVDVIELLSGKIGEKTFYTTKTKAGIDKYKDIGRNDDCPCGSGKKHKKCCLSS